MEVGSNLSTVLNPGTQLIKKSEESVATTPEVTPATTETQKSEFETMLAGILQPREGGVVSEEDLFAAVLEQKVTQESKEAGDLFKAKREEYLVSMRRPSGFVPMEDMAKAILQDVVAEGKLTTEVAERIHGESFRAAQLDDNMDALYDHLGGPDDVTMAVASLDDAITLAKTSMDKIVSGELVIESMSLSRPSNTKHSSGASHGPGASVSGEVGHVDGLGGFVWKPVSESDQKLIVVMPERLKDQVDRVELHRGLPPTDENLIATHDEFTGYHAGNRGKFRFAEAGADYGINIYVVAFKNDGSTEDWLIEDGSRRND